MGLLAFLFVIALALGIFPAWYALKHDLRAATYPALVLSILGIPFVGWLIAWYIVLDHIENHPSPPREFPRMDSRSFPLA